MRFLLFLGAGASARFGLPTSGRLLGNIKSKFPESTMRIQKILDRAEAAGYRPTLETLLGVLDSSSDPKRAVQLMGPYVSSIASPNTISKLTSNKDDERLAKGIKEYIVAQYFVRKLEIVENIKRVYDDFLRGLKQRFALTSLSSKKSHYPRLEIFTTNFDNVIEVFGDKTDTPVFNGYTSPSTKGLCRYSHQKFMNPSTRETIRIYKIHGTVTHAINTANQIGVVSNVGAPITVNGRPAVPKLIYPGAYHYLSEEPQLELLYLLKRKLHRAEKCLVIGYSFGDPNIAQVFHDSLDQNSGLRVALVSKSATSSIGETPYREERVKPIQSSFELSDIRNMEWN
jgi:hypothetical protein